MKLKTNYQILVFSDHMCSQYKISEVENNICDHAKYITTPELNKFTAEKFTARLKQVNLVHKTDFDNKLPSFNRKITSNMTKYLEVRAQQIVRPLTSLHATCTQRVFCVHVNQSKCP